MPGIRVTGRKTALNDQFLEHFVLSANDDDDDMKVSDMMLLVHRHQAKSNTQHIGKHYSLCGIYGIY